VTAETGLSKVILEEAISEVDNPGVSIRKFDSVTAAMTWALTGLIERKPAEAENPPAR
jgi:hypothetical protein